MSSPFSQAYMDKSPFAELNARQERMLPIELQNAINAKEGNEAKDASPAENKIGVNSNPNDFFDNINDGGKAFGERTGITGYSYEGQGGSNYEGSVKLNESTDNQFVNSGSAKFHEDSKLPKDYSNRPEPTVQSGLGPKPKEKRAPYKATPGIITLNIK